MSRHINAGSFLFHLKLGLGRIIRQVRQYQFSAKQRLFLLAAKHVKQAHLAGYVFLSQVLRGVHRGFKHRQHLRPVGPHSVKGACTDQTVCHPLVAFRRVNPPAEIEYITERPAVLPLPDNCGHRVLTDAFDRAKAEQDRRFLAVIRIHCKFPPAAVHVRRQHSNAFATAVLDIAGNLTRIAVNAVEHGRHKLHRIIPFQPGRFHGHHTVCSRVGLVEGIAGKSDHFVIDLVRHVFRYTVAHAAGNCHITALICHTVHKDLPFLFHHFVLLLGHCPAYQVTSAVTVSGQVPHNLHHLLLIYHASVCHIQNRLQFFGFVPDAGWIHLAGDISGNGIHRTGPVQGDRRDDILKAGRFHVCQEACHACAFHLENAVRISPADHFIDLRIVQGNILGLHVNTGLPHHVQRVPDNCQCTQPQEVHFQQTEPFNRAHRVLGGNHLIVALERHKFHYRFSGNQYTGRVGGCVPWHALQRHRGVNQFLHLRLAVVHLPQHWAQFQRLFQRHSQVKRDCLGNRIRFLIAHAQHPAHIAYHALGRHGTEGYDLTHMIRSVFPGNIIYDFLPPFIAEINVNIRHADPFRIQEPLKQQLVLQRVQHRDPQGISHNGAGAAAAARADHNPL